MTHTVLTVDGHEFEVRQSENGLYVLWSRQQGANQPWEDTLFVSRAATQAYAESVFFSAILKKNIADLMAACNYTPDALLRAWRHERGMTQRAAADALGVSCRSLETWERGGPVSHWPAIWRLMCLMPFDPD